MSSSLPALDAVLDDPERALRLLGDGPARDACVHAVRSFLDGVRAFPGPREPDTPFAWEGWGLAAMCGGVQAFAAQLARAPMQAPWLFVGAGWHAAIAGAPPLAPDPSLLLEHPHDAPFMLDGWGYCVGLLRRRVELPQQHELADPLIDQLIDQGRGRSSYFIHAGRPAAIARAIAGLERSRHAALWRGVGIASVVTNGIDDALRLELQAAGGEAHAIGEQLGRTLLERTRS